MLCKRKKSVHKQTQLSWGRSQVVSLVNLAQTVELLGGIGRIGICVSRVSVRPCVCGQVWSKRSCLVMIVGLVGVVRVSRFRIFKGNPIGRELA